MSPQPFTPIAYLIGICATVGGLFSVTVSLAGNDYTSILRWALVLAGVASLALAYVFVAGSKGWRILAVVSFLPLLYVVAEAVRRGAL